jgi:hypothetical protein
VAQARLQIAEDHKALIRHETRKIIKEIVQEMPMMARGVRPKRDKFGEVERENGKILCEDIGAAVQTQVWQVAAKLSQQHEDAPATKVELSTPGGIQVEATYSAEVEALRARIS